jgi:hypothetical protein
MKLVPIHTVNTFSEGYPLEDAEQKVMHKLGDSTGLCERGTVPFYFGCQLLVGVYRDIQPTTQEQMETYAFKPVRDHWMIDDFYQYTHPLTNKVLFYAHYSHGDYVTTFFTIEED